MPISEAVKTFRFLAELIFIAGVLASSIGATAGAYIITSEFPGSVYNDQWTDWFVGDVSLYRSWLGAEAADAKSTSTSPDELLFSSSVKEITTCSCESYLPGIN